MNAPILLIVIGIILLVVSAVVPMASPGSRLCMVFGVVLLFLGVVLLILPLARAAVGLG